MKLLFLLSIIFVFLLIPIQDSFSELDISTNSKVYSPDHTLQVYGTGLPEENLILRLFAPDESITKFEQIQTNPDGTFNHQLLTWPNPSSTVPYGTYVVEVLSTEQNGLSKKIDIKFSSTTELISVAVERQIDTVVFAPETGALNQSFRVFIQTTRDGLNIGNNPSELLKNSIIHLPDGSSISLNNSFKTLYAGVYYFDFTPRQQGTHVFQISVFNDGVSSKGFAATHVLSQNLGGINKQITKLNSILDETSIELNTLKSEISGFDDTLSTASNNINESTDSVSSSVKSIEEASSQLNSLLFPIIASIGLIVALQITIIARRR
ncbi:methyl-accepting chemotaxis protein [Nitrosopumilus sp.]|nr:methyl-accepting chemotaxis protein [Nitrosopumilus sp.]MDB4856959.1 methyl-accepting chemotaxis protein [Nitrosopumilus sp.]